MLVTVYDFMHVFIVPVCLCPFLYSVSVFFYVLCFMGLVAWNKCGWMDGWKSLVTLCKWYRFDLLALHFKLWSDCFRAGDSRENVISESWPKKAASVTHLATVWYRAAACRPSNILLPWSHAAYSARRHEVQVTTPQITRTMTVTTTTMLVRTYSDIKILGYHL